MTKQDLTQYDNKPAAMVNYLRYNGAHFTKELCEFAVGKMKKKDTDGKMKRITPWTKEEVDEMLKANNVKLEYNELWDYVYVANMCKADFFLSSIEDKAHVAKYIKDVIDDADAYDGIVFNRWYADMCHLGYPIDWAEMM